MPKKKEKEPFFHITQPGIKIPQANMQEIFSSKKAEKQKKDHSAHPKGKDQKEHELKEEKTLSEQVESKLKDAALAGKDSEKKVQEIIENFEAENSNKEGDSPFASHIKRKPGPSFKRLKSFKDMNTIERLNYLIDFPKQLPPVPCIFETEKESWRGILVGKAEETIEIKMFDGKTKSIEIQTLKEIRMSGLRK
ncbi:CotO family spore coat protein [Bacillus sp. DTU_2020_1000418_1_SI_GHA_SEK_038]|uniref:CotO family spore coat protein n=1 Tax=Bacillus sp. DTU_2020_1000418_1_SI_GHA_SEK_038 TaxID=3077585 RepID=UPI0028EEB956|nr:CotO family spore coat protein [Bacillus sp. DTU_2020_1000418_1_SI_GHA_SEK_038]WNS76889.1 CotO family spore coat protein [Bacillus sp. DTU_2020_1000418_1_SI_GHA_SEK_038]